MHLFLILNIFDDINFSIYIKKIFVINNKFFEKLLKEINCK